MNGNTWLCIFKIGRAISCPVGQNSALLQFSQMFSLEKSYFVYNDFIIFELNSMLWFKCGLRGKKGRGGDEKSHHIITKTQKYTDVKLYIICLVIHFYFLCNKMCIFNLNALSELHILKIIYNPVSDNDNSSI